MMIFILTLIYILSFWRMYIWMKNAHSKDGIFDFLKPNGCDVFITICPVFNTITSFYVMLYSMTGKKQKENTDTDYYCKFFNIKK